MLPMGTIVTCCMFAGLLATTPSPISKHCPSYLLKCVAAIVLAAGLWNVLWYSTQHLFEFWGQMALISGIAMIITSLYVLIPSRTPALVRRIKPFVLLVLFACAMTYAITIARL